MNAIYSFTKLFYLSCRIYVERGFEYIKCGLGYNTTGSLNLKIYDRFC